MRSVAPGATERTNSAQVVDHEELVRRLVGEHPQYRNEVRSALGPSITMVLESADTEETTHGLPQRRFSRQQFSSRMTKPWQRGLRRSAKARSFRRSRTQRRHMTPKELSAELIRRYRRRDLEGLVAMFSESVIFVRPDGTTIDNIDGVRAQYLQDWSMRPVQAPPSFGPAHSAAHTLRVRLAHPPRFDAFAGRYRARRSRRGAPHASPVA